MNLEEAITFVRTKENAAREEGHKDLANCYVKMRSFLESASTVEEAANAIRTYAGQKNTLTKVGALFTTHANFFQYGKLE